MDSYNHLMMVSKLAKLAKKGNIHYNATKWNSNDKTRFIDSLLKNINFGTIILAKDMSSENYTVLDGNERMAAMIDFANGMRLQPLHDVDENIQGKTLDEIEILDKQRIMGNYVNTVIFTVDMEDIQQAAYVEFLKTRYKR